ncbi:hypothetical protein EPN83_02535 [Patescibacteria group bacterium]|nr:MAG: hypothetical protein EPN83_02535 [Patescibacteria group bacterium]
MKILKSKFIKSESPKWNEFHKGLECCGESWSVTRDEVEESAELFLGVVGDGRVVGETLRSCTPLGSVVRADLLTNLLKQRSCLFVELLARRHHLGQPFDVFWSQSCSLKFEKRVLVPEFVQLRPRRFHVTQGCHHLPPEVLDYHDSLVAGIINLLRPRHSKLMIFNASILDHKSQEVASAASWECLKNFSFLLLQNMVRAGVFTGSLAVFRFAATPLIFAGCFLAACGGEMRSNYFKNGAPRRKSQCLAARNAPLGYQIVRSFWGKKKFPIPLKAEKKNFSKS